MSRSLTTLPNELIAIIVQYMHLVAAYTLSLTCTCMRDAIPIRAQKTLRQRLCDYTFLTPLIYQIICKHSNTIGHNWRIAHNHDYVAMLCEYNVHTGGEKDRVSACVTYNIKRDISHMRVTDVQDNQVTSLGISQNSRSRTNDIAVCRLIARDMATLIRSSFT